MTKDELIANGYEEVPFENTPEDSKLRKRLERELVRKLSKKGLIKTFIGGGRHLIPLNDEDYEIVNNLMPKTKFVKVT